MRLDREHRSRPCARRERDSRAATIAADLNDAARRDCLAGEPKQKVGLLQRHTALHFVDRPQMRGSARRR
jgi:hypothetical protein